MKLSQSEIEKQELMVDVITDSGQIRKVLLPVEIDTENNKLRFKSVVKESLENLLAVHKLNTAIPPDETKYEIKTHIGQYIIRDNDGKEIYRGISSL